MFKVISAFAIGVSFVGPAHAFNLGETIGQSWEDTKHGVDHALHESGKAVEKGVNEGGKALTKGNDEAQKIIDKKLSDASGRRRFNLETDDNPPVPAPDQFWMAVVGDSSTTGAVADPGFRATWLTLLDHAQQIVGVLVNNHIGNSTGLTAPLRVMYDHQEFTDARDKTFDAHKRTNQSKISQNIDTAQYSFGYQLGRRLNIPPEHIVLTGQDGVQVSSLNVQFERILEVSPTLPPLILISYVANDLCHPSNFSAPVSTFAAGYEAELRKQFDALAKKPADPTRGTRVVFLAPLDVENILKNPQLLDQTIDFEGSQQVTCRQLRRGEIQGGDLARILQGRLNGECRGILANFENPATMQRVHDLQVAQNDILQKVIGDYAARGGLRFEYAKSTKNIPFEKGDLANDCFHPSRKGAERLANDLLANELSNLRK